MKAIRLITALFLVFSVTFTTFYGAKKINDEKISAESQSYKGIISMWQIDSFEGGIGSRKQFLLKVARSFEKKHNGVLIMVTNLSKEGAEENFKNGVFPDLISYGNGVNVQNVSEISVSNTVKGGQIGDKTYATAWCRGGYVLITNPNLSKGGDEKTLLVSKSDYTLPLMGLLENEVLGDTIEIMSPMDAYVKFVSGKVKRFLGTQRDINRLKTRGMEVEVTPLEKYNDLYQYVSITSSDQLKRYYAEQFINYLVSKEVQSQLCDIGMLSCFYSVEQQSEHLQAMQKISGFNTISAFTSAEIIEEIHRLSLSALEGNKDARIKIENMLI